MASEPMRSDPERREGLLMNLRTQTENKRLADESWERTIHLLLDEGVSERVIGAAAGISGPAVHYMKERRNG